MSNKLKPPQIINLSKPNHGKPIPKVKGLSPAAQKMLDDGIMEYKNGMIRPSGASKKLADLSIKSTDHMKLAQKFRLRRVTRDVVLVENGPAESVQVVEIESKDGRWQGHLPMSAFYQELLGLEGKVYVRGVPLADTLCILEVLLPQTW